MLYILIGVVVLSLLTSKLVVKLSNENNQKISFILKFLSITLLLVYMVRLFSSDVFDNTFNLLLIDIETPIDSESTWVLPFLNSIVILMLRWITLPLLTLSIIKPFKTNKFLDGILASAGIVIPVLNILFLNNHIIAFNGVFESFLNYRSIEFIIENMLILMIGLFSLRDILSRKYSFDKKDILKFALVILGLMIAFMPQYLLINLMGNFGEVPDGFKITHIFFIVLPIISIVSLYLIFRKKSFNDKDLMLLILSFAGAFQFLYSKSLTIYNLPLHLCNTVVILLVFANAFKIRKLFYFSYFAGVLGAIAAIVLPNYSQDLFSYQVIHFSYNHLYVVILPILGVALGVFSKPTFRLMLKALFVFVLYYISVVVLNAWFNNYFEVDYFFTYDDFITDMFGLRHLQYNYVLIINKFGLEFKFFWLYQILFFLSFIALMFASWFLYDMSYQIIASNKKLRDKERMMRNDYHELLKSLDGKDLSEPMNPGGKDMIRVIDFSKRYGESSKYAVKNLSFEVPKGSIYGFLGHNGAGKSTTIKSLVGIQSITDGDMEICGYSIKKQPLEAKLQIGYVSDNHAVYEKLTGREYIKYVADLYRISPEVRDERLNDLANRLSLTHALDNLVKSYSHGMKQKLVVIASLIHQPPVWILDEPLTGLDPISAFQIKEIMKEHAQKGNIVFFSSHVIEVIEKICDKIVVIAQGELVGIFDVSILNNDGISLEDLYMRKINLNDGMSNV